MLSTFKDNIPLRRGILSCTVKQLLVKKNHKYLLMSAALCKLAKETKLPINAKSDRTGTALSYVYIFLLIKLQRQLYANFHMSELSELQGGYRCETAELYSETEPLMIYITLHVKNKCCLKSCSSYILKYNPLYFH